MMCCVCFVCKAAYFSLHVPVSYRRMHVCLFTIPADSGTRYSPGQAHAPPPHPTFHVFSLRFDGCQYQYLFFFCSNTDKKQFCISINFLEIVVFLVNVAEGFDTTFAFEISNPSSECGVMVRYNFTIALHITIIYKFEKNQIKLCHTLSIINDYRSRYKHTV